LEGSQASISAIENAAISINFASLGAHIGAKETWRGVAIELNISPEVRAITTGLSEKKEIGTFWPIDSSFDKGLGERGQLVLHGRDKGPLVTLPEMKDKPKWAANSFINFTVALLM